MKTACNRFRPRRAAFTLIELLVVIAIIAILIGILVPAVQKVRESASRTQCTNNLKQLCLACHTYADAHNRAFPPGAYQGLDSTYPAFVTAYIQGPPAAGWGLFLLPYIEQQPLYQQYNWGYVFYDTANSNNDKVSTTALTLMQCPSVMPQSAYTKDLDLTMFGLAKYPVSSATSDYSPLGSVDNALVTAMGMTVSNNKGALQANCSTPITSITDGTSGTFLLVEIAARPQLWQNGKNTNTTIDGSLYPRGGWADAETINSVFYGSTPDGTTKTGTLGNSIGINASNEFGLYSFHTGGANAGMCDGSVRFLSASTSIKTLIALVTKAGDEPDSGSLP